MASIIQGAEPISDIGTVDGRIVTELLPITKVYVQYHLYDNKHLTAITCFKFKRE